MAEADPADRALTEATRAVVLRYHQAWKRRDRAAILACYHPDIAYIDYFQGLSLSLADLPAYLDRAMPAAPAGDGGDYLEHIDRIRADGDTAFIQYRISLPLGRHQAELHSSEAIAVRDGLIWRIREYATLTRPAEAATAAKPTRPAEQKLGLSARQIGTLARDLDGYFARHRPYLAPDLDLTHVAQATGYTRNQISYLLNQVLGVSFYQYVTQKRLQHCLTAMAAGSEAKTDAAAFAAGFNSLSAFYRAFRQSTGVSPAAYRRSLAEKPSSLRTR
ncbi:AraC family transcriptional regulator [Acidisoma silvae]|uniref:Helix-turn-helix domain-containing protein n=1 Tax=Acidisoma silvae TaxID=2802396 RepID=A0A963YV21_9PROT|nr:nuclear transport factor 2 family protein [Acidisoma silvae]MCB8877361.1 helix-turn-helix domain-containing protein [Acidisoma silvae]